MDNKDNEQIEHNKKGLLNWESNFNSDFFDIEIKDKKKNHAVKLTFNDKAYIEDINTDEITLTSVKKKKITANEVRVLNKLREKKIEDVFNEMPKPKEYIHVVSDGSFDYFGIVQRIIELNEGAFTMHASTWTMNYNNIENLLTLIKVGRIKNCTIIVGEYLRQREPLVFETLKQGLYESGKGRLNAFKNHCKIICLSNGIDYFVCEGSANFTANPRAEQHILTNNKELYEFHVNWMNETFNINKND